MASRDERDDMYATESVFNGCRENIKAVMRGNSITLVAFFFPYNLIPELFLSLINEEVFKTEKKNFLKQQISL